MPRDDHEDLNDPHWYRDPAHQVLVDMVRDHESRLRSVEEWRAELRGAFALMRVAFGASIISAAVSILALADLLSRKT